MKIDDLLLILVNVFRRLAGIKSVSRAGGIYKNLIDFNGRLWTLEEEISLSIL